MNTKANQLINRKAQTEIKTTQNITGKYRISCKKNWENTTYLWMLGLSTMKKLLTGYREINFWDIMV